MPAPPPRDHRAPAPPALWPLPDKPSIAVLPFANMSGDTRSRNIFADLRMSEDHHRAFPHPLAVRHRPHSSFTYKGPGHRREAGRGRELVLRYVLEGSVRKSRRARALTAQLIDALTDHISGRPLRRVPWKMSSIFKTRWRSASRASSNRLLPRNRNPPIIRAPDAGSHRVRRLLTFPCKISLVCREQLFEARDLLDRAIVQDPRYGARPLLGPTVWPLFGFV